MIIAAYQSSQRSYARSWRTSGTNRLDRLKTEAEAEEQRRAHGG
jgi:hypothetical protein